MTNTSTNNEREERLKQIRARQVRCMRPDRDDVPQEPHVRAYYKELRRTEMDRGFLLSLYDELESQLAQVTQERDSLQEQLAEEVAKRVNGNVERMEQSQKVVQAELERHCSDDRLSDTQRGSYQD